MSNAKRAAERSSNVCANCVRAMVVSATVTVNGMARTPEDADRPSTATRMGSPRNWPLNTRRSPTAASVGKSE